MDYVIDGCQSDPGILLPERFQDFELDVSPFISYLLCAQRLESVRYCLYKQGLPVWGRFPSRVPLRGQNFIRVGRIRKCLDKIVCHEDGVRVRSQDQHGRSIRSPEHERRLEIAGKIRYVLRIGDYHTIGFFRQPIEKPPAPLPAALLGEHFPTSQLRFPRNERAGIIGR
jgi:hypothetical protein